jgi:hypothetical protein
MVIKRVSPLSLAKIAAVLYAGIGLIVGLILSLVGMAGVAGGLANDRPAGAIFGAMFGVGAIVIAPILYGCIGFVFSLIGAALFNLAAGMTGGLEIDVQ